MLSNKIVGAVLNDEERHVRYTREMVFELLPRRRAHEVLAIHRAAEEHAHRAFSSRQIRNFLQRFSRVCRKRDRFAYALGALLLERGLIDV